MSQYVLDRRTVAHRLTDGPRRFVLARVAALPRLALGAFLIACSTPKLAGLSLTSLPAPRGADAAAAAIDRISFGVVTGHPALLTAAALETLIGLLLLGPRWWRVGIVLLAGALVTTMSPFLFFVSHIVPLREVHFWLGAADIVVAGAVMLVTAYALAPDRTADR